ncbi:MAG: hypothetical protein ACI4OH_05175 [Mitsuokella sp.]|uniref:hypothetical protein n=1 Tax=Mitsuokella sp. TaxID=2049034 RepID=UPI003F1254BD
MKTYELIEMESHYADGNYYATRIPTGHVASLSDNPPSLTFEVYEKFGKWMELPASAFYVVDARPSGDYIAVWDKHWDKHPMFYLEPCKDK